MNEEIQNLGDVGEATLKAVNESTAGFVAWVKSFITWDNLFKVIGVVVALLIFWLIYKFIIRLVRKIPQEKISNQASMVVQKIINYAFYIIVIMYVLGLFGIKLSAIWGAAGVAGVAVAFAAQTSVSNLISGIFVIAEKALKIGDLITVSGETGIVDSVGLLSVKMHTLDNQMIRIPNSTIINTTLQNTSYFAKRRMTIAVSVSYDTDMEKALETLKKAPLLCPLVLKDPAPGAWFDGFDESGINLTLAVWFKSSDFIDTKNQVFIAIKKVYDEAKIEIPYNKLDVKIYDDVAVEMKSQNVKLERASKKTVATKTVKPKTTQKVSRKTSTKK